MTGSVSVMNKSRLLFLSDNLYFQSVEEAAEKIIVYDSYNTVVEANLVKTKLDAYGIPCFLSEENFTTLYPFKNQLFPGVRLHIFEKDFDQVKELLEENALDIDDTLCPTCGSKDVAIVDKEEDKGIVDTFLSLIQPSPKTYRCKNCTQMWD
jgi:Zn finger protein HypA/HybF involved in hydrogenase expression